MLNLRSKGYKYDFKEPQKVKSFFAMSKYIYY